MTPITRQMIEAAARVYAHRDVFNENRWPEYADTAESMLRAALAAAPADDADAPAADILDAQGEDAATMNSWSDRNPATIVKRTAKTIVVQEDRATNMSGAEHDAYANGRGEVVIFTRDTDAPLMTYTLRKNGRWIRSGSPATARGASLTIGTRSYYRDPSF